MQTLGIVLEVTTVPHWSFLTNYALVLTYISQQPESTGLEIAQTVGITERATRKIVADLQAAGYIEREKVGRRNRYRVDVYRTLGHIGERELTVHHLLQLPFGPGGSAEGDEGEDTRL